MNPFILISFFAMFFSHSVFALPDLGDQLDQISSGPELPDCPENSTPNYFDLSDELSNTDQVISILSRTPLVDTNSNRYSIIVDIPAYNGQKADRARVEPVNFPLQNFFIRTSSNVSSYASYSDLESAIIADEVHRTGGPLSTEDQYQISEQVKILEFTEMMRNGNYDQGYNFLNEEFSGVSGEKKISFLGALLNRLSENYDYGRMGDGPGAETVTDQMLSRAIFENNDGIGNSNLKAGVCRHMHQFAVKAARAMGINLSFGMSYATLGGYHLSMIATDPDVPGKTYKLNYGNVKDVEGMQGQMLLDVNNGNVSSNGINFHIWGEDRNPVYFAPSERGLTLAQIAGEDIRAFDPNVRPTAKKAIANADLAGHNIRLFYSHSNEGSSGEHMGGAGYAKTVKYNEYISGNYGAVLYGAHKENTSGIIPSPGTPESQFVTDVAGMYLYIDHELNANILKTDGFKLNLFSRLSLRGTGYYSKAKYQIGGPDEYGTGGMLGDGNGQLISGFVARIKNKLKITGEADVSGQMSDINDMNGVALYGRRFSLLGEFKERIGRGLNLLASGNVNLYPLDGNNIKTAAVNLKLLRGRNTNIRSFSVGALIPLQNISPGFIQGSRTSLEGAVKASILNDMFGVVFRGYYAPSMGAIPDDMGLGVSLDFSR